MKIRDIFTLIALCGLVACNKSSSPAAPSTPSGASSKPPDAVQQALMTHAGTNAVNCGRFDIKAAEGQLKTASDCATQASQSKRPFYVIYDMPGMSVGVAGDGQGKLTTSQTQGSDVTTGDCPSQLRVASSGRVTCFAPGDMGSMSGSHAAGSAPPGTVNPHGAGGTMAPSH